MDDVVRPSQPDGMIAGDFGEGIADRKAGDQRDLKRLELFIDRHGEGDGESALGGPPGVSAPSAASSLIGGENDRRGEEVAALAEDGGVVVGAFEAGEEMEAEGPEFLLQSCYVKRGL